MKNPKPNRQKSPFFFLLLFTIVVVLGCFWFFHPEKIQITPGSMGFIAVVSFVILLISWFIWVPALLSLLRTGKNLPPGVQDPNLPPE
jgi:hypothetical protein